MKRGQWLYPGLLGILLVGCVKSIPGYDGPRVDVNVANDTAVIAFTFPTAGYTARIDRSEVVNDIARVYVSTSGGGGLNAQVVTRQELVFRETGKPFTCCEVFVKASGSSHADDHVPAAQACR